MDDVRRFLRAVRTQAVEMVGGTVMSAAAIVWGLLTVEWPSLKVPWLPPWVVFAMGVAVYGRGAFLAWREEYQKRITAEEKLEQTRPYYMAEEHQVAHAEVISPMPAEMADPYRFFLLLVLKIEANRRPAFGTDGRLIVASHDLTRQPSINTLVDGGYTDSRVFNLGPSIQVPPNTPPHFIALELRYEDPVTHQHYEQAWYWRFNGSTKDGVFSSEVLTLSKADTDRFIVYLKNLDVGWSELV